MPLRIALTHAFCWPEVRRGGERYLHELAGALKRRGNKVTIISSGPKPSTSKVDDVRVVRLPRGPLTDTFAAERRFGKLVGPVLAAGRFDVVHALGARDAAAAIRSPLLGSKRRTVYTNLGIPLRESWDNRPDGEDHKLVVEEIDVYGALSRFAQRCLLDEYGRTGVVTPGGVRLDRFVPRVERSPEPTLLFPAANNEPRKNLPVLLEALAIVAKSEPRVKLLLSGPGDPSVALNNAPQTARDRTEVLSLGSVADQPDRYAAAWATVLPSRLEAFGLVLVESLACGTPVVAADHASLPEIVEPQIGRLAAEGDPQALATACLEVLAWGSDPDLRERCRSAAQRHDWDGSVAPTIEAFYLGTEHDSA